MWARRAQAVGDHLALAHVATEAHGGATRVLLAAAARMVRVRAVPTSRIHAAASTRTAHAAVAALPLRPQVWDPSHLSILLLPKGPNATTYSTPAPIMAERQSLRGTMRCSTTITLPWK
jgi:hypothetical protein